MGCGPGYQEHLQQSIFGNSQHEEGKYIYVYLFKSPRRRIPQTKTAKLLYSVLHSTFFPLFNIRFRFNAVGRFLTRRQFLLQLTALTRLEGPMW